MAIITFEGTVSTNQYLTPLVSHVQLSHPSLTDSLLLAEHDERPYENFRTGQTRSNERSLQGSIRLKGNNWKKDQWLCNFIVKPAQSLLFEQMVQAQQDDVLPVVLVDRWQDGSGVTKNVWLEIDRQYLTMISPNDWFKLQFQALEV
jgi:hypothetical protein